MLILVCNVGSTSLKYKLYDMPEEDIVLESKIERVGGNKGSLFSYKNYKNNRQVIHEKIKVSGYSEGINIFLKYLVDKDYGAITSTEEIGTVAFKTVHAKGYNGVHVLTEEVISAMVDYISIAPLHNRFYIEAINTFKQILPDRTMVGVFETAFHRTIPKEARMYGIPYEWYKKYGIQKYGFHGSSHQYIASTIQELEKGRDFKLISCHLGGSSSLCAVENGKSIDNSFGFSTQSGVLHANRIGDIDPFIPIYLINEEGYTLEQVVNDLVYKSGLYGISGISNDLRDIETEAEKNNPRAKLAIETFCYSIKKYIGSFYAILGGLDYLVFTGGIGENSSLIRSKVCDGLQHLGLKLDPVRNKQGEKKRLISSDDSPVKTMIIPTNEEIVIAENVYALIQG